jgi:hypothetical protein
MLFVDSPEHKFKEGLSERIDPEMGSAAGGSLTELEYRSLFLNEFFE